MRARTLIVGLQALLSWCSLVAPAQSQALALLDEGFEHGELVDPPFSWHGPAMGPRSELVTAGAFRGERCARLDLAPGGEAFGNLMTSLPVAFDVRSRVVLHAAVRVEGAGSGRAQLWLRFDYKDGESVLVDNMGDRSITAGDWAEQRIVADVEAKPGTAVLGLMVFDGACAYLDEVRLELAGPSPLALEPARALEARGLANLVAFARLFGVVRYFHPSDEAAAADWERFAVEGVRRVEGARDVGELRATLHELFDPIAPSLRIVRAEDDSSPHPALVQPPDERNVRVRAWEHHGMGQQGGGVYRSRRVNERVRDGALPADVANPAEPFRVELGDGLVALLPLALFSTRDGTLPRATPDATQPASEALALTGVLQSEYVPEDRATRIGAVVSGWNVFQHFYPYFDVVEVDWPAELERALGAAAEDADARAFGFTLQRMVAALRDGHGGVYHASLQETGALPLTWDLVDGALVVTAVDPADGKHIAVGDVVLAIDGVPIEERLTEIECRMSAATPQFMRYRTMLELTLGSLGTTCLLDVRTGEDHESGMDGEATLAYMSPQAHSGEPRPEPLVELEPGIWYVDLDAVTTEAFLAALDELAGADGIVFDMRGYPAGFDAFQFFPHLIEEPVESPQWHVPVLARPDREGIEFVSSNWTIQPKEPYITAKRVFITDGRAISYAESCMGIVEHYELGEIVGEATAGTNGNVNPFKLPGGYSVSWTGMRVLKQDGSRHHGVGIQPTLPVVRTRAGIAAERDELLEAALAVLRQ